jgi:hypothetical protein
VRLLTFELGLRFFTDYLAGDVYFKVKYPEHNLQRALVQFKLTESIEAHEADIRHIIRAQVKSSPETSHTRPGEGRQGNPGTCVVSPAI